MAGYLGSGDVFFEVTRNGIPQGLVPVGNTTKLEVKENSDTKTRMSKKRANYGSALDTVVIKKPADVSLTIDDLDKENLGAIFMGLVSDIAEGAVTITDEAAVVSANGVVALGKGNISAVTVNVDDGAGTGAAVPATITNQVGGFIELDTTGLNAGDPLLVSYTATEVAAAEIKGGLQPDLTVRMIMLGINLVDGKPSRFEAGKAVLTPQSAVDFLSEEFTELELTGVLNVPEGKDEAYTFVTTSV